MDIKEFYYENIDKDEYHYRFYQSVKDVNKVYNIFQGSIEVNNYSFEIYDTEEAIQKFKELCQPEVNFDNEKCCWFYLICYYLYKTGYEIKEFPRILARPPADPTDFTYGDIRNSIIASGGDDNGIVRYATRRRFVSNLTFEQKKYGHVDIDSTIEQRFIEISNRKASFDNMATDEKLAEISNLIENFLKRDGKFVQLNYENICCDLVLEDDIKRYRKKMHCFRHSSDDAINERKEYSELQKDFLIDYGLTVIKVIHELIAEGAIKNT